MDDSQASTRDQSYAAAEPEGAPGCETRCVAPTVTGTRARGRALTWVTALCAWLVAFAAPQYVSAGAGIAARCEVAADAAARDFGVPARVLRALALTETGRNIDGEARPWPWALNHEGRGRWFETRQAAEHAASRLVRREARSFDIGCFQINYHWHGEAFDTVGAMFEPAANARYAAAFLARLHAEKGSWEAAAGAYHSRTPGLARAYRERFRRIHARLRPDPAPRALRRVEAPAPRPGAEAVPLVPGAGQVARAESELGSLVRVSGADPAPIIVNTRNAGGLLR